MKIKTKKQLNLPRLIEWGFGNDVTGSIYSDDRVEAKKIRFEVGVIASMYGDMHKGDTFTVETEEEITEDTKIFKLVHYSSLGFRTTKYNASINELKDIESIAFYSMDSDYTMKLIWTHDKGLVE